MDLLGAYRTAKLATSDAACALLSPVTPTLFAKSCARFADGLLVTIELLVLASAIGFGLAIAVVLARVSGRRVLSVPAYIYCYVFRGTPLLVQLWILYFGLGALGESGLGPLWPLFREAWWVGLLALILNTAAYVAEILRGGIENVPKGQAEAAAALGLSWAQSMRSVIFPQALRISWPAYGNEVVLLLKGSALVSTITVLDLMGQTRTVFSRSYSLEIFLYGAVLYLLLAGLITLAMRAVERRFATTGASLPSARAPTPAAAPPTP